MRQCGNDSRVIQRSFRGNGTCPVTPAQANEEELEMPYAVAKDNVRLYFEEAGSGTPIIFLHEFAADHTNWEPQMRYFGRHYRCIAYNARGFTPSDVPDDVEKYSQERARDDVKSVFC